MIVKSRVLCKDGMKIEMKILLNLGWKKSVFDPRGKGGGWLGIKIEGGRSKYYLLQ